MTDGPRFDRDNPLDPDAIKATNKEVVEHFRANGGKVGGDFEGFDLVLLHTTGAKSGEPRTSPLAYLVIDDKMLVVGSYGGAPQHPAWVHNLRAEPRARIEVGDDAHDVTAREVPADEREVLYRKIVEVAPQFGEYQTKTKREIPLFELVRV